MATEMPTSLLATGDRHARAAREPGRPAGAGRARWRLGALGLAAALGLTGLSTTAQAWPRGAELKLDATSHFDYEGDVEDQGDLLGLAIAYTGEPDAPPGSWPLRFEGRVRTGETGSDTEDTVADLRLLTGEGPAPTLFYGGLGYRFWDQELPNPGSTTRDRDRDQRYGYVPLGVRLEPSLGDGGTVHLEAEYQLVFWGEAEDSRSSWQTLDMDNGYGLALRTGVRYPVTSALALSAELYFQYWDLDASRSVSLEPADEIEEAGLRLGINW